MSLTRPLVLLALGTALAATAACSSSGGSGSPSEPASSGAVSSGAVSLGAVSSGGSGSGPSSDAGSGSTSSGAASSAAPAPADLSKIVGNGRTYRLPATADVPASAVPNPCDLLPAASASAALGAPVTMTRTGSQTCSYFTKTSGRSVLEVQFGETGTDSASQYARSAGGAAKDKAVALAGVGLKATTSVDMFNPTDARTDVLVTQLWFWVDIQPGPDTRATEATSRAVTDATAKAIAGEFPA